MLKEGRRHGLQLIKWLFSPSLKKEMITCCVQKLNEAMWLIFIVSDHMKWVPAIETGIFDHESLNGSLKLQKREFLMAVNDNHLTRPISYL
jgi:hypothetical protein